MNMSTSDSDLDYALGRVKMQAAALLVGMPFYSLVVTVLLTGIGQALALGLYGVAAGGWVIWRTRRAVRGAAEVR
ncbi:hypothetical protein [Thiohalorhabdus methylotrophus]|uniref:Uncharacterized protein n=1 Tax=Thiohalorhabdus methylotrophus TaxID=3242694 RepID=A0ABV4TYI4_9GAMM